MQSKMIPYLAMAKAVVDDVISPETFYSALPSEAANLVDRASREVLGGSFRSLSQSDQKLAIVAVISAMGEIATRDGGPTRNSRSIKPRKISSSSSSQKTSSGGWKALATVVIVGAAAAAGWYFWSGSGAEQLAQNSQNPAVLADQDGGQQPPVENKQSDPEQKKPESQQPQPEPSAPEERGLGAADDNTALIVEITSTLGDASLYSQRLEQYVGRFPQAPRSDDFRFVRSDLLPIIDRVDAWNSLLDRWTGIELDDLELARARNLADETSESLRLCGSFEGAGQLQNCLDCLSAVMRRTGEDGQSAHAGLIEFFQGPEWSVPYVLRTKEGKQYYLPEAPQRTADGYSFEYVIDARLSRRQATVRKEDFDRSGSGKSPVAATARQVIDDLSGADSVRWESVFYQLLRGIHAQATLDPIVKIHCLHRVLNIGCDGSAPLKRAFQPHLDLLASAGLDPAMNWLDTDDVATEAKRAECRRILAQMPDLRTAAQAAAKELKRVESFQVENRLRWIGFVLRNADGQWQCHLGAEEIPASTRLVAVDSADGQEEGLVVTDLGQVSDGAEVVSTAGEKILREGRPIFAMVAASPNPK